MEILVSELKQYLEIAKIINTHGIRGDVKLDLWCDSPNTIKKIKTLYCAPDGSRPINISDARMHGKFMLLHIAGIENPEDAAKLKETVLYANRDDVPKGKGDFFIADLIGVPVIDAENGTVYGTLTDVMENPANAIYEIKTKKGTVLFPAVKEFLVKLDPPTGIYIRPIPGMFTEAVFDDEEKEDGR